MEEQSQACNPGFDRETLDAFESVHRFAYHLTGDSAEAEDLVQETYARAYANRTRYQVGTNCVAWLCTICRNLFLRRRSTVDRESAVPHPELEALAAASIHGAAQEQGMDETTFERQDFRDALEVALRALSEEFRSAVVLVDIEEFSYAQAARSLGIPVGTLRSRLFRGRRLLQRELVQFAIDAGIVAAPSGEV